MFTYIYYFNTYFINNYLNTCKIFLYCFVVHITYLYICGIRWVCYVHWEP